jgi:hypothetical protein
MRKYQDNCVVGSGEIQATMSDEKSPGDNL